MGTWCIIQGAQPGALWQPRGMRKGGREVQEGGDTCTPMTDSCWCRTETNTTL